MQKIDQGCYIATDVRWGMVLDLSSVDDQSLIAYGFHGQENQQARALWEFLPCGAGYVITSVKNGSSLVVRDIKGLLEGGAVVVTGAFPTCWEVEVMYNGNRAPEDGIEDDNGDVYVRYV
ncbi:hypothetical protein BJV77DRAFT_942970 [Russula vinacea]|nr:hypothetical protein BJV77DRAFT_942970 [Russula vinacea]